jgi:putative tricarboxylic transport membrane protein
MRSRNLSDTVIGLVFAGLGVGIIIAASGLRTLPGMAVGSGLFPIITGGGMIFFGLLLAVQALFFPTLDEVTAAEGGDEDWAATGLWVSAYALLTLASLAALMIVMPRAGFIATGVVFATIIARLGGARWWTAGLFAVAVTVALYAVFVHGLRVPLPRGLLG